MNPSASHEAGPPEDALQVYRQLCREALESVEYCLTLEPKRCQSEVDDAERTVIALRDKLIAGLRQAGPSGQPPELRAGLERANVTLSLIVGVEYPATGSQRSALEMARDTLRGMRF